MFFVEMSLHMGGAHDGEGTTIKIDDDEYAYLCISNSNSSPKDMYFHFWVTPSIDNLNRNESTQIAPSWNYYQAHIDHDDCGFYGNVGPVKYDNNGVLISGIPGFHFSRTGYPNNYIKFPVNLITFPYLQQYAGKTVIVACVCDVDNNKGIGSDVFYFNVTVPATTPMYSSINTTAIPKGATFAILQQDLYGKTLATKKVVSNQSRNQLISFPKNNKIRKLIIKFKNRILPVRGFVIKLKKRL